MRTMSLFLAMLCCAAVVAHAGPNQGGTLLFHYNAEAVGSDGSFAGTGGLADCAGAVATAPAAAEGAPESLPGAWFAYAAFPAGSSPRLSVVTFGLNDYDPNSAVIMTSGKNADGELPTSDPAWPNPLSGIAVQWNEAQTSSLKEVYWFTGYGYAGSSISLTEHPTQGGGFTDDAVPAHTDPITAYGTIGFGVDGSAPCPVAQGACCLPGDLGQCEVMIEGDCQTAGGIWNPDTSCDPNPCPQPFMQFFFSGPVSGARGDLVTLAVESGTSFDPYKYSIHFGYPFTVFALDSYTFDGTAGAGADSVSFTSTPPKVTARVVRTCQSPVPQSGPLLYVTLRIKDDAPIGPITLDLLDEGGADVNRLWACPSVELTPELSDLTFTVLDAGQGACCGSDGTCTVTLQGDCSDNWLGEGIPCDPNPCPQPTGACCALDGTCTLAAEADCQAPSEWMGAGTVCDPSPCPPPMGACCLGSGECLIVTSDACTQAQGNYLGNGVGCDPNPCETPIQTTTWGRLKNQYR